MIYQILEFLYIYQLIQRIKEFFCHHDWVRTHHVRWHRMCEKCERMEKKSQEHHFLVWKRIGPDKGTREWIKFGRGKYTNRKY